MKQTKIVATIGPATNSYDKILNLAQAGMNVARINLSHGTWQEHQKTIELIKKVRKDLDQSIAIMIDTRGPELRLGNFVDGKVMLNRGDKFSLVAEEIVGDNTRASINHPKALALLKEGDKVLACNALVILEVIANKGKEVVLRVLEGGVVSNHKSLLFANIQELLE